MDLDNVLIAASTEQGIDALFQNLAERDEVILKLESKHCTVR